MPATILAVLRALVDAAFKAGGITDLQHADLSGKLDQHDPALNPAPEPEPEPVTPMGDAVAGLGQEGTGFDG